MKEHSEELERFEDESYAGFVKLVKSLRAFWLEAFHLRRRVTLKVLNIRLPSVVSQLPNSKTVMLIVAKSAQQQPRRQKENPPRRHPARDRKHWNSTPLPAIIYVLKTLRLHKCLMHCLVTLQPNPVNS